MRGRSGSGVDYIASTKFVHTDAVTGESREWVQENEDAVTTREEAVGMIQRTIDFWQPKLRDDLVKMRGMSLDEASKLARETMQAQLNSTLSDSFPKRFGLKLEDFRFG